jgi:hypothetical protein
MSLNKIKSGDSLESIISLYDYKLPFVVAEYVCRIYRSNIVCNTNINYKSLFANFIEYKDHIQYIFGNAVDGNKNGYSFIKLTGVEVSIPIGKDSEFMDKYSNIIFSSSADCGLEWYDEEDLPNEKIDLDKSKYIGRCKLTF